MRTNGTERIIKTPGVCWRHARIRDTRISVKHIIESLRAGATPADLVRRMPHVTVEDIDAAQQYYHTYQAEIDREIAEGAQLEHTLRQAMPSMLHEKRATRHAGPDTFPPG
jgi:uncharacterized protein (DUF433 family)